MNDTNAMRLSAGPMSRLQVAAVATAVGLNAIDGFDVLAISFAAPVIAREWGIGPAVLGAAISAGLVGMTIGSLVLAPLGDRFGRRPLVLVCTALMGAAMLLTATATTVVQLCAWRVLTGIGIGGMLAAINAVAAEFSSERRRDLAVALMTIGYPAGGLIGGFASAALVASGWQTIFWAGGLATLLFLPIAWFAVPESISWLEARGRSDDDARIGQLMRRFGLVAAPHSRVPSPVRGGTAALFARDYRQLTLLLIAGYFLHILTFYFFSGWLPKFVADLGFATSDAIRTSAIMSIGGVIGGGLLGLLVPRFGLARLGAVAMTGTAASMATFAMLDTLPALQAAAFVTGACVYAGVVSLYSLFARSFPAQLRVTGTGLAVGLGRGGAVAGPILGGVMLQQGVSLSACIIAVGSSSLAAAVLILRLRDTHQT